MLPAWLKWSKQFPLHENEVVLRNYNWVELLADHDVISKGFFKQGRSGLIFKGGKCTIILHVPNEIMENVIIHMVEVDAVANGESAEDDLLEAEFTVCH